MCDKSQLQIILSEVHKKAVAEFGVALDAVILYGSYARGDFDEESDIDVMVRVNMDKAELSTHRWNMSELTSNLSLEYNVTVSVHLQDCSTFERFKDDLPFYMNVLKDGVHSNCC